MKLIIDIPDHLYNVIKNKECTNKNVLTKAVENGTPLEDVKAEIAKPIQEECYYVGAAKIQADTIKWCLEILDNIGKAESEVKPNDKRTDKSL